MPILLIRHGNTTYDDKVDGLLNPPLDHEGVERVERTAQFLKDKGIIFSRIISSPLQRAIKTADIIARGSRLTTHQHALPWHLGDYMGRPNDEVNPLIWHLEDFPYIAAPHGESYARFYNRWISFLAQIMQYSSVYPEEVIGVTTHSRNINALQTFIGGAGLGDIKPLSPEASVTLLAQDEAGDWHYKMIWQGN